MKAPYAIELIQVDNGGFYVKAGCKTLVYTSLEQMTNDLRLYFTDPRETIERLSAAHGWPLATGAGLAQELEPRAPGRSGACANISAVVEELLAISGEDGGASGGSGAGIGLADFGYSSATPQLKYPGRNPRAPKRKSHGAETEEPREMRPPPNEGRDRP